MADVKAVIEKEQDQIRFDFVGKMKRFFTASGVIIALFVVALLVKGLNYGIDFEGGSIFHYRFEKALTTEQVRSVLEGNSALKGELGAIVVQRVLAEVDLNIVPGEKTPEVETAVKGSEFIIHTGASAEVAQAEDIEPRLEAAFVAAGLGRFEKLQRQFIGPTVGRRLQTKALWALIISIVGILLYISIRFEFVQAVAAVVALLHDSLFVLGLFCLLSKEINIGIMAAVLTIIGYSLNDTIVILDRIRENNRLKGRLPYDFRVNLSINQSLSRTINTSVTTLLAVLALLVLGGVVIRDFALAMTVGVFVGTYSSVFIVAPIVVKWYYRDHPNAPKAYEEAH